MKVQIPQELLAITGKMRMIKSKEEEQQCEQCSRNLVGTLESLTLDSLEMLAGAGLYIGGV